MSKGYEGLAVKEIAPLVVSLSNYAGPSLDGGCEETNEGSSLFLL